MKKLNFLLLMMFVGFAIFSENWESLIPGLTEGDLSDIEKEQYADRSNIDYKEGLELLPKDTGFNSQIMSELAEFDPELCVELLYVIDKPNVPKEELMLFLLNNFRAFSDQAGLEYYSHNRGKMYPLIKKSYFVNENNKKIDDPTVSVLPQNEVLNYYQDDTTFGSNYYTLKTRTTDDSIWIQMENLDKLTVFTFFKAIDKGGQRLNFIISESDDKLLLYSLAQIKEEPNIKQVLKWKVNIPGSFKRRIGVIVEWFQNRIY